MVMPSAVISSLVLALLCCSTCRAYGSAMATSSSAPSHLQWGDELRSIDLRISQPRPEFARSPDVAFNTLTEMYAVAKYDGIELLDGSWKHVATVGQGTGTPESICFSRSGKHLVASYAVRAARGQNEFLRVYDLRQLSEPAAGPAEASVADIAHEVVSHTQKVLQSSANWTSQEIGALQEELIRNTMHSLTSANTKRDILRGVAIPGTLSNFQASPFSNDGHLLYVLSGRNEVSLTDVATKEIRFKLSHPPLQRNSLEQRNGFVNNEAIMWIGQSPDSRMYATVSWDHTVILWDAQSGAKIRTLTGATGQNWAAVFAPDSTWIAVGSGDKNIYVYDTATGQLRTSLSGFPGWIRTLAVSQDGTRLAAGSDGGSIIEFDTGSWAVRWKHIVRMPGGEDNPWERAEVVNVQYVKQDTRLICKVSDQRLLVLSSTGEVVLQVEPVQNTADADSDGYGHTPIVLPGDEQFYCSDGDSRLRFWAL